jgi:hypothetical protein
MARALAAKRFLEKDIMVPFFLSLGLMAPQGFGPSALRASP